MKIWRFKMRFKLTKQERSWILYDVGNSAFTLLVSTIMPIYFNYLAGNAGLSDVDYLAYWGYAASIATLVIALIGPVCGTLADTKGYKKPIFTVFFLIGAAGCISLGFARNWLFFLALYVVARMGYSGSLIFYDSMLSDVTVRERMDHVSSQGFAWGYIGSCVPFILSLILVLFADSIGISMETAMMSAFVIISVWWGGMTLPLLKNYQQKYYVEKKEHTVLESFVRLKKTFANVRKEKKIFLFLLAFPFALLFGKLSVKYDTEKLIKVCIIAYFGIAVFAMFLSSHIQFWILAILVGMFQGGIQALSRSYFTKIIPAERSGEYFGLLDICGKGASVMGTTIVSVISQLTGNINMGVGMISILFAIGFLLFRLAVREEEKYTEIDTMKVMELK